MTTSAKISHAPAATTPPEPGQPGLCVMHLGRDYIVVDKQPHTLSVPGRGEHKHDSIQSRIVDAFPEADGPITVHRLDWETSGLIVAALTRDTHRTLSRQFMNRKVGKSYVAILEGIVQPDRGAVDLPLIVDWPNRPKQKVDDEEGRPARTLFRVIERDEASQTTRVEFRPITGRSHQLRVHAATPIDRGGIGAPIVGDSLYGDATRSPRLLLHSNMLAFWEPGTGDWKRFTSDPPF